MRHVARSELGLVLTFGVGMLVTYVGLAVSISGRERFAGFLVLALGLWLMLEAPIVHDRLHREAGEESHALWGRNDRWKPHWLRFR